MTGDEFRSALARLELNITGPNGAEEFFGVGGRTARRWINNEGPPEAVAMLIKVMLHLRLKPATVRRIFETSPSREQ